MHTGKIRTIRKTARFELEMARIQPSVKRADEFLEGAEHILARQPDSGYQLDDSNVWIISGHTVDVILYYTFDDDHVDFLSINKFIPPEL